MKTLKNILEEKINKQRIYENIIKQETKPQIKKWILVPICFLFVSFIAIYPSKIEKSLKKEPTNNKNQNNSTYTETNSALDKEEDKKNSTYSKIEDTMNRYVDTEENLKFPFSTRGLPKNLKITKNQKVYYKEQVIGIQKIYKTSDPYKEWIITYYNDRKMEEKEDMLVMGNRKYLLSERTAHIYLAFNYKDLQVNVLAFNTTKEEILNFLKAIEEDI